MEVLRNPRIYWGYRLLIGKEEWRRLLELKLPRDPLGALAGVFELFASAGEHGEALEAMAEVLMAEARVEYTVKGRSLAAVEVRRGEHVRNFPGVGPVDLAYAAGRIAQAKLGRLYDCALILIRESGGGLGASIYTRHGGADRMARRLVEAGVAESGGGRDKIAGLQGVRVSPEELLRALLEVLDSQGHVQSAHYKARGSFTA